MIIDRHGPVLQQCNNVKNTKPERKNITFILPALRGVRADFRFRARKIFLRRRRTRPSTSGPCPVTEPIGFFFYRPFFPTIITRRKSISGLGPTRNRPIGNAKTGGNSKRTNGNARYGKDAPRGVPGFPD